MTLSSTQRTAVRYEDDPRVPSLGLSDDSQLLTRERRRFEERTQFGGLRSGTSVLTAANGVRGHMMESCLEDVELTADGRPSGRELPGGQVTRDVGWHPCRNERLERGSGGTHMSTVKAKDGATIFYKDCRRPRG